MLLTFALLARHLGHDQFALNATITALTNVAVQICGLGSQESLVRRVAQTPSFYPEMLGHVHILNIVSAAFLIATGMIVIPLMFPVSDTWASTLVATALILVTNIILLKLVWLATNSYIAHSRFAVANKIEFLFALLRMTAAVVSCLIFNISTVVEWAAWNFAAHAVAAAISLWAISRLGKPKFRIVREEVPIGVMFASQFFFKAGRSNADILVLSAVASSELVASYSIARRLMEASYMSVEALNRILYPSYATAALSGIGKVYARARRMLFVTVGLAMASACLVWLIAPALTLLFGQEYVSLSWITRYLCWVVIPVAISATAFEALGACGLQSIRAKISNISNIAGAGVVLLSTLHAGLGGLIATTYWLEIVVAGLAWWALSQSSRVEDATLSVVSSSGLTK
jgi:O-antigen/teichoic acid export membrane protein